MSRAERKQAEPQRRVSRTKAGEEITAEFTEALASEAEQGYDLAKAKRQRVKESMARPHHPTITELDVSDHDEEMSDEDLRSVKEARSDPGLPWSDAELDAG